jgi:hypothetical protein
MAAAEGMLEVYPVMLGGLCGLTSWLSLRLRMPLPCDVAPGTLCCLKARPAGEESRDECGEAAVDGEREVDSDWTPLLRVPEPVPDPLVAPWTAREFVCGVCAGRRSFGHRVTLFVFGSVLFAGSAVRAPVLFVAVGAASADFSGPFTSGGEGSRLVWPVMIITGLVYDGVIVKELPSKPCRRVRFKGLHLQGSLISMQK